MLSVLFSSWITELKRIVGRKEGNKKSCLSSILTSTAPILILEKTEQERQTWKVYYSRRERRNVLKTFLKWMISSLVWENGTKHCCDDQWLCSLTVRQSRAELMGGEERERGQVCLHYKVLTKEQQSPPASPGMHTLASKVSIQQQSKLSSPRYYYKISENQSTCSKLLKYWRILITFLFTQVSFSHQS